MEPSSAALPPNQQARMYSVEEDNTDIQTAYLTLVQHSPTEPLRSLELGPFYHAGEHQEAIRSAYHSLVRELTDRLENEIETFVQRVVAPGLVGVQAGSSYKLHPWAALGFKHLREVNAGCYHVHISEYTARISSTPILCACMQKSSSTSASTVTYSERRICYSRALQRGVLRCQGLDVKLQPERRRINTFTLSM